MTDCAYNGMSLDHQLQVIAFTVRVSVSGWLRVIRLVLLSNFYPSTAVIFSSTSRFQLHSQSLAADGVTFLGLIRVSLCISIQRTTKDGGVAFHFISVFSIHCLLKHFRESWFIFGRGLTKVLEYVEEENLPGIVDMPCRTRVVVVVVVVGGWGGGSDCGIGFITWLIDGTWGGFLSTSTSGSGGECLGGRATAAANDGDRWCCGAIIVERVERLGQSLVSAPKFTGRVLCTRTASTQCSIECGRGGGRGHWWCRWYQRRVCSPLLMLLLLVHPSHGYGVQLG